MSHLDEVWEWVYVCPIVLEEVARLVTDGKWDTAIAALAELERVFPKDNA